MGGAEQRPSTSTDTSPVQRAKCRCGGREGREGRMEQGQCPQRGAPMYATRNKLLRPAHVSATGNSGLTQATRARTVLRPMVRAHSTAADLARSYSRGATVTSRPQWMPPDSVSGKCGRRPLTTVGVGERGAYTGGKRVEPSKEVLWSWRGRSCCGAAPFRTGATAATPFMRAVRASTLGTGGTQARAGPAASAGGRCMAA